MGPFLYFVCFFTGNGAISAWESWRLSPYCAALPSSNPSSSSLPSAYVLSSFVLTLTAFCSFVCSSFGINHSDTPAFPPPQSQLLSTGSCGPCQTMQRGQWGQSEWQGGWGGLRARLNWTMNQWTRFAAPILKWNSSMQYFWKPGLAPHFMFFIYSVTLL